MLQQATVYLIVALVAASIGVDAPAAGAAQFAELSFYALLFVGGVAAGLFGRSRAWTDDGIEPRRALVAVRARRRD